MHIHIMVEVVLNPVHIITVPTKLWQILHQNLGQNPKPFLERSKNIHDAVQKTLWIPEKGSNG